MRADDLVQQLTNILFVLVFLVTGWKAVRRPLMANVDTALLFGAITLIVAESWITEALGIKAHGSAVAVVALLLMALPYLLLRLVDDFARVPFWVLRGAEAGLILTAVSLFAFTMPYPRWQVLLLVAYFAVLAIYCSI